MAKKPYNRLNPSKPKHKYPKMPPDHKQADLIRGVSKTASFRPKK